MTTLQKIFLVLNLSLTINTLILHDLVSKPGHSAISAHASTPATIPDPSSGYFDEVWYKSAATTTLNNNKAALDTYCTGLKNAPGCAIKYFTDIGYYDGDKIKIQDHKDAAGKVTVGTAGYWDNEKYVNDNKSGVNACTAGESSIKCFKKNADLTKEIIFVSATKTPGTEGGACLIIGDPCPDAITFKLDCQSGKCIKTATLVTPATTATLPAAKPVTAPTIAVQTTPATLPAASTAPITEPTKAAAPAAPQVVLPPTAIAGGVISTMLPGFNNTYYLNNNPDLAKAGYTVNNADTYFLGYGYVENTRPIQINACNSTFVGYFNLDYYLTNNASLITSLNLGNMLINNGAIPPFIPVNSRTAHGPFFVAPTTTTQPLLQAIFNGYQQNNCNTNNTLLTKVAIAPTAAYTNAIAQYAQTPATAAPSITTEAATLVASTILPGFNNTYYLANNPDLAKAGYTVNNADTHFMGYGYVENNRPIQISAGGKSFTGYFNLDNYLTTYPDVITTLNLANQFVNGSSAPFIPTGSTQAHGTYFVAPTATMTTILGGTPAHPGIFRHFHSKGWQEGKQIVSTQPIAPTAAYTAAAAKNSITK